ncbi:MAG: EamA family transporter [Chloroflexota bacterium]
MRPTASPLAVWAGLVVLYLVWGSTYLGIRIAVETIPPFTMGGFRFFVAGVILATAVGWRSRRTLVRPSLRQLRDTTIVASCLMGGGMGLVAWGEGHSVPSGVAALLIGLMPMWLAILSRIVLGERLAPLTAVGIGIGIIGVAILAWPTGEVGGMRPEGLAALIVSPMLWSAGTIYAARKADLPRPALFSTGVQMMIGGLVLFALGALTGELATFDLAAVSTRSTVGLLYLTVIGSLVGYTTYAWLLTVALLPRIATYAYVNPVVAVVLGALIASEPFGLREVVASVVIVAAVVLIVTARSREQQPGRLAAAAAARPAVEDSVAEPGAAG